MLTDLLYRLRAVFRRGTVERELDDELRFHYEHEVEKLERRGLSRGEAQRRARLAVGGMGQVAEECREARGVSVIETTLQDLRYGLRGMRRRPAFTAVAVLTLGLGTGAVATVFTLADTLFYRELRVERPQELVHVTPTWQQGRRRGWVSYPDYLHFRDRTTTLRGLAVHNPTALLWVHAAGQSAEITGATVSANFFPLLGLRPAIGRFFSAEEEREPVAVISHAFWRQRLGARDALGETIRINGVSFTVIGVMPEPFRGIATAPSEIYVPIGMAGAAFKWCANALAADCNAFDMIGRLAEGRTFEEARAEVPALVPASWAHAKERGNTGAVAIRANGEFHPDHSPAAARRFVRLLAGVASVLLLVCCANLAGLLMARNAARAREFAIRSSLGAGRGRLTRQLATESLLLGVSGGVFGVVFSLGLTGALNAGFYTKDFAGHPLFYDFTIAPWVIAAVLGVSAAAGLALGLPAGGGRGGRWLVGAQAAVAVALAAVAGLMVSGARDAIAGAGFDSSHVALLRLRPALVEYTAEKAQRFHRTVVARVESIAGVESVSLTGRGPLTGGIERVKSAGREMEAGYIEVAPRFFETLGAPLLGGREFDARDIAGSPAVAVVNETLSRRVGEFVTVRGREHRVVGVVRDLGLRGRGEAAEPYLYVPYWQNASNVDAKLIVRVKGDPAAVLPALVREAVRAGPDVPMSEVMTLPAQLAGSMQTLRITASFVSFAAVLAVFLSAIGIYASLAFSVSRRTREIGIRIAVGAAAGAVRRMVIGEGMGVIAAGAVAGVGLGMWGSKFVRHLLFETGGGDVWWYGAAGAVVSAAGLLACWVPARRATRIEPMAALKEQ